MAGLAYVTLARGNQRVVTFTFVPPDGWTLEDSPRSFEVSPDGSQIAFVASDVRGRRALCVRALDSLDAQMLTGTDDATSPFWSPDSRFIAFRADDKLKKIAVTGGAPTSLCDVADVRGGTWSGEGVILFASGPGFQKVSDAGRISERAGVLASGGGLPGMPQFLPAGRHSLYRTNSGIHAGSLDSTTHTPIVSDPSVANFEYADGRLIFLRTAGGVERIVASLPAESFTYDFSWNMWMLVISWMVLLGLMQPSNPDRAFRLLAAKSLPAIQRGAIASCVLLGLSATIAMSLAWTFRVLLPGVENPDLVMPLGIARHAMFLMPLFIVAVWAGGMSTLDSGLMACASMLTQDVYKRNLNPQAPPARVMMLSRLIIVLLGVFATFVALAEPPFLWYLIGAAGGVAMQWLPAMLFGLYWKRANAPAAWAGIVSGMTTTVLFQYVFTSPWPGPGGPAIMGFSVQVPLYVIVALLTRPQPEAHLERYQGLFRADAASPVVAGAPARQELPQT